MCKMFCLVKKSKYNVVKKLTFEKNMKINFILRLIAPCYKDYEMSSHLSHQVKRWQH